MAPVRAGAAAAYPDAELRVVLGNYGAHKRAKVREWLAKTAAPLHPGLLLLAQPGRVLLLRHHAPGSPPRLVPLHQGARHRDRRLHRHLEPAPQAVRLGQGMPTRSSARSNARRRKQRPCEPLVTAAGCELPTLGPGDSLGEFPASAYPATLSWQLGRAGVQCRQRAESLRYAPEDEWHGLRHLRLEHGRNIPDNVTACPTSLSENTSGQISQQRARPSQRSGSSKEMLFNASLSTCTLSQEINPQHICGFAVWRGMGDRYGPGSQG